MTTSYSRFLALVLTMGCTAQMDASVTKEEAARLTADGKADGRDFCDELGWYGDGVCDDFCPLTDQDCTGGACTVGADSTCDEGESCALDVCYLWCAADDPICCPGVCAPSVPDDPGFCASALCGPGTRCDEGADACIPDDPGFCASALCGPGTRCDEAADACVADDPSFCASALCGPGRRCDEAADACVPDGA
jgi:hypothetical protein